MISAPSSSFIKIFNLKLNYYGICIASALIVCFMFLTSFCKNKIKNLSIEVFYDIFPLTVLFSIIGARLYYVILNYDYYIRNLSEIVKIQNGGISIHGAIIAGFITLYFLLKHKNVKIFDYIDAISVVLPLGQAIGRFGNYFNQEAYGKPCSFSWCLYVDNQYRPEKYSSFAMFHPAFLYEILCNLLIFIILFLLFSKIKSLKSGTITCLYLILYSLIRFFIELLRIDSNFYIYNIPFPAIASIIIFLIALVSICKIYFEK